MVEESVDEHSEVEVHSACQATITDHKGLVLAGVDAVTVLPSAREWVAIPSSGRLLASISAQLGTATRGWISVVPANRR